MSTPQGRPSPHHWALRERPTSRRGCGFQVMRAPKNRASGASSRLAFELAHRRGEAPLADPAQPGMVDRVRVVPLDRHRRNRARIAAVDEAALPSPVPTSDRCSRRAASSCRAPRPHSCRRGGTSCRRPRRRRRSPAHGTRSARPCTARPPTAPLPRAASSPKRRSAIGCSEPATRSVADELAGMRRVAARPPARARARRRATPAGPGSSVRPIDVARDLRPGHGPGRQRRRARSRRRPGAARSWRRRASPGAIQGSASGRRRRERAARRRRMQPPVSFEVEDQSASA